MLLKPSHSDASSLSTIQFIRTHIKRRSKVFSKTSRITMQQNTRWEESIQNSHAVALWVVFGFSLSDEFLWFVDNARISCLECWLQRWYNFLTGNKVTDVCLISFQFSNIVYSKGFATKLSWQWAISDHCENFPFTDAYRQIDRWTDRMLIEIPRLHRYSAVKIDWHYTQNCPQLSKSTHRILLSSSKFCAESSGERILKIY